MSTQDSVIRVPAELKDLVPSINGLLTLIQAQIDRAVGGKSLDYAKVEEAVAKAAGEIERAGHGAILASLNTIAKHIKLDGVLWVLVATGIAQEYMTRTGPVVVARSLYRQVGERNGSTIDPVSTRAGVVGEGWLPGVAKEMAFEIAKGPSREAEKTACVHHILPYSRASFERVGHAVGEHYLCRQADIEDELMELAELPPEAVGVSLSIDRGSIPMEEPASDADKAAAVARGEEPPQVVRAFRMGYCGTINYFDRGGECVQTTRYALMPGNDPLTLCRLMGADLTLILQRAPNLILHAVADGAPEIWKLLGEVVKTAGKPLDAEYIDFGHLKEKVGKAAMVAYGEQAGSDRINEWCVALKSNPKAAEKIHDELMLCGHSDVDSSEGPIHDALTYIQNNSARMNYADAVERGLPIGSGIVEATVKSLIEGRMKRPGARWKQRTGDHVLQLRALANSERWDAAVDLAIKPLRKSIRAAA